MRPRLLGLVLATALLVAAAPARADIFAVAPVVASGHSDIGFCRHFPDTDGACTAGQGVLPQFVSSPSRSETRPAFTPDGRYIGFIRDEANGHERLYVFDTDTQTLVDPTGADLGLVIAPDSGSLNLYERPRALTKSGRVRDLGTPRILRIR